MRPAHQLTNNWAKTETVKLGLTSVCQLRLGKNFDKIINQLEADSKILLASGGAEECDQATSAQLTRNKEQFSTFSLHKLRMALNSTFITNVAIIRMHITGSNPSRTKSKVVKNNFLLEV